MSGGGTAALGRFDRLDLVLGAAIVGGAIGTLAMVAIPDFHGHVFAPAADLAFDTFAFVVTVAVAALSWVRYRGRRQPIAFVQAAAFLALAIADGAAVAVAMGGDLRSAQSVAAIGAGQLFVWVAARLLAAGLLVAGGLQSLRGGQPRHPLLFLLGTGALMLVVVGAVAVLGERLTSLLAHAVPDDLPFEPEDLALTGTGVVVQLVGAALFLAAASVSRQLWRRDGVVGDAYLALGLIVAAFAQLHGAFFPSAHPVQLSTADLLRLGFYIVLFLGIQAEARAVMGALRAANDSLARLRDAEVERAALEERARLSRELHDGLAQDLWLAKLKIGRLAVAPGLGPADRALAEDVARAVDVGLADARQAVIALRDIGPATDSFGDLLERYVGDVEDRFGMTVSFDCVGELPQLAPRTQADVLRIVQEALSNAARHADARAVRVRVAGEGADLVVSVVDDGRGFEPARVEAGHVGLMTMRERAALIGADLAVDSKPGAGTRVVLTVPAEDAALRTRGAEQ
jgi:signal transduction histidine kinase